MSRVQKIAWCLFPLVVALAAYGKMFDNYFLVDDWGWLYMSHQVLAGEARIFQQPYWGYFRPIINIWFYLVYVAFGLNAVYYYLANFILHAGNVYLVFRIVDINLKDIKTASIAALLFSVNVPSAEALLYVSGISDILSTSFVLLSFYSACNINNKTNHFILSSIYYALALFAKETTVLMLPLLILSDVVVWRFKKEIRYPFYGMLGAITLTYLSIGSFYWKTSAAINDGIYGLGWHVVKNIFIMQLSLFIPNPYMFNIKNYSIGFASYIWQKIFFVIGLVMLAINSTVWLRGSGRMKMFVAWVLMFLLPASLFLNPPRRTMYLAASGFSMLLALIAASLPENIKRITIALLLGLSIFNVYFIQLRERVYDNQTKLIKRAVTNVVEFVQSLPQGSVVNVKMDTPPQYYRWDVAIEQGGALMCHNNSKIVFNGDSSYNNNNDIFTVVLTDDGKIVSTIENNLSTE